MIDFHNAFCEVLINILTVNPQNKKIKKNYFPVEPSNINIWSSFQRLKQPFRKSKRFE